MPRLAPYLDALRARYGRPGTPEPGTPLEPVVRAILSPGASPKSVEKALHAIKVFGLLDAGRLRELDPDTIALAIKPVGGAHAKAVRLRTFVAWFIDRFGGDLARLKAQEPNRLREELLEIGGIGPETADLILLEGLDVPAAVADTAAYRVLTRHEILGEEAGYDDVKDALERGLPRDAAPLREFRALADRVGREYCRPQARCLECPLKPFLPAGPLGQ